MARHAPARLSAAEGRRFGVTVGIALLALGVLLWWRDHAVASAVVASLGVLLLLGGVFIPAQLGPVHALWMGFALALSRVTTPVLMAIVYFIVITPIGLLRRALGKSPIHARAGGTGWVSRGRDSRSDLNRQF